MPPYSAEEKTAGRHFRDWAQAALERHYRADPPTFDVPHILAVYGHLCTGNGNRTIGLALAEHYQPSPDYDVFGTAGTPWLALPADNPEIPAWIWQENVTLTRVPAGRFAFIFRRGRCKGCGKTAMSPSGRLVDGWRRKPLHPPATRG